MSYSTGVRLKFAQAKYRNWDKAILFIKNILVLGTELFFNTYILIFIKKLTENVAFFFPFSPNM